MSASPTLVTPTLGVATATTLVAGAATANASAVLEANSTTQGFLPPRMTNAQKTGIASPVAGLMIWCSNCGTSGEIQVYNGTTWTNMIGNAASGSLPILAATTAVTSITGTSASSGGNVTSDGGATITARGVCWSTTTSPTTASSKTTDSGTTGAYASSITGLTTATLYYVRAYATNSVGTAYGAQVSFTTLVTPTATSVAADNITTTGATLHGTVNDNGSTTAVTFKYGTDAGLASGTTTTAASPASVATGTGSTSVSLAISSLIAGTTYYYQVIGVNGGGTTNCTILNFTTFKLPTVTTQAVTSISSTTATGNGNVTNLGVSAITQHGVVWKTSTGPTISDFHTTDGAVGATGAFTSSMTGLSASTLYVRAYATNSAGTVYGNEVSFSPIPVVTNTTTGKIWMDRNLGASQVATSSTDAAAYGDLYQWGRGTDGHQLRTSVTTSTLSSLDAPGHANFITNIAGTYDWRSPQNDNLWQGVNGVNNPCPSGFRIPTSAELETERLTWASNNDAGAFGSPLLFSVAGYRFSSDGSLSNVGSYGYYWSSTVNGTNSSFLNFYSGHARMTSSYRAYGFSVRCIKD